VKDRRQEREREEDPVHLCPASGYRPESRSLNRPVASVPGECVQVWPAVADCSCMSVSGISSAIRRESPSPVQNDRTVLVLKKAQDASKAQGQALADLVSDTTETIGRIIKVYA
jgi:hypothetical protein